MLTHTFLHATIEKQHIQLYLGNLYDLPHLCTVEVLGEAWTVKKLVLQQLQVYSQLCAQNGNWYMMAWWIENEYKESYMTMWNKSS